MLAEPYFIVAIHVHEYSTPRGDNNRSSTEANVTGQRLRRGKKYSSATLL
jgi:hypothetical protein